MTQAVRRVL